MNTADEGEYITLDEMVSRAIFEPELVDIYVEGREDVALLRPVFEYLGIEVAIFPIKDRVHLPSDLVADYDSDYGNRSHLLWAADYAEKNTTETYPSLVFLVDSDWTSLVGPIPLSRSYLFQTDLPSMEHYHLELPNLSRFLRSGLNETNWTAEDLREATLKVLRDIAAARIFLKSVNVKCTESLAKLINTSNSTVDYVELIKRSLNADRGNAIARGRHYAEESNSYREWIEKAGHQGRGHDIAVVLISILKLKNSFADPKVVEALLRTSSRAEELAQAGFVQEIARRVETAAA